MNRLLYRSEIATPGPDKRADDEVRAIVAAARVANAAAGLTGALCFSSGVFIQALEGEGSALERTFERICCDLRHTNLKLLDFTAADERIFPQWSMARIAECADGSVLEPLVEASLQMIGETTPPAVIIHLMRSIVLTSTAGSSHGKAA